MTRFLISSVALAAGLLLAAPAYSRAVVIDTNSDIAFTPCTYGALPCNAFSTTSSAGRINVPAAAGTSSINFGLNYGNGQQSDVFVYNNGLIVIGDINGFGNSFTSLASFSGDVLTPVYDASLQVLSNSFTYSTGVDSSGLFPGSQFLRINYTVRSNNNPSTDTIVQANFFQSGNPGDFILFFAYGTFANSPVLPNSAVIGYNLNGSLNQTTAGQNQAALANSDDTTTFRYQFVGGRLVGAGAVPEPATWLQLILGFGLLGLGLRRLRGSAAARPALS